MFINTSDLALILIILKQLLNVIFKIPILSISHSTTSPLLIYRGGENPIPTPEGVPVAIMSPASKVIPFESSETMSETSDMNNPVLELCLSSPFTLLHTLSFIGKGTALLCKIHGPKEVNVSNPFL